MSPERIIDAAPAIRPANSPVEAQSWSEISLMPPEFQYSDPTPQKVISLMGTDIMGLEVYKRIKEQGHRLHAVFAPPGERDKLRKEVEKDNELLPYEEKIPLYDLTPEAMKDPMTAELFSDEKTDLGVFASVTYIAPKEIYDGPKNGTIGIHDSYLDEGRGGNAAGNAIRKKKQGSGPTISGVSIYQVTKGEDEGDKFFQAKTAYWDNDTPFNVFPESTVPIGAELMANTIKVFAHGDLDKIRTPQDLTVNTKEPLIGKRGIDWNRPSEEVFADIRGSLPYSPYTILHSGEEVDLSDPAVSPQKVINLAGGVSWLPDRKYPHVAPGTIVSIGEDGAIIATADGAIRIKTLQLSSISERQKSRKIFENKDDREEKLPAIELANRGLLSVGDKFESIQPDLKAA